MNARYSPLDGHAADVASDCELVLDTQRIVP